MGKNLTPDQKIAIDNFRVSLIHQYGLPPSIVEKIISGNSELNLDEKVLFKKSRFLYDNDINRRNKFISALRKGLEKAL